MSFICHFYSLKYRLWARCCKYITYYLNINHAISDKSSLCRLMSGTA